MKIVPVHPLLKLSGKIILAVIAFLLLITGAAILFLYVNSDRIKSFLLSEMNRQLNAKVEVREIALSPWKKFPHTSLWFREVSITPKKGDVPVVADTLLHAGHLYLVFDISDLIRKKYILKKIHISEGSLQIRIDEDGTSNYSIWKTSEKDQGKSFSIELRDIELRNMVFSFHHHTGKIQIAGHTERTSLKGDFTEKGLKISGKSEILLQYLMIHNLESEKAMEHKLGFSLEKQGERLDFTFLELKTAGLTFTGRGIIHTGENKEMDFSLHGEKLDIRSLIETIPPRYKERLRIPRSSGQLDIDATIKGPFSENMVPRIEGVFSITGAGIVFRENPYRISHVNCRGSFTNGSGHHLKSTRLEISSFSASYGSGFVKGKAELSSFIQPVIKGEWTAELNLEEISGLLQEKNRMEMSGSFRSNLSFSLTPAYFPAINLKDLAGAVLQGHMSLKGVNTMIPGSSNRLTDINGDLLLSERVWFENLSFRLNGVPFEANGQADNLLPGLLAGHGPVEVWADARSPHLNMNEWLENRREENTNGEKTPEWPRGIRAEIRFRTDTFSMNAFRAQNAEGILSYEPGLILYPSLDFETMQGKVNASGMLWQQPTGDIYTHTRTELKSVEINELFTVFNNFGQEFIQARHLKGRLSGNLMVKTGFDPLWKTRKESIVAEGGIVVEQGELRGFEPMLGLSRFTELEELEHIRFSRLENNILINNQTVIIPKMDISSNAFNISVTGRHEFNNQFRYHLRVYLSEILTGKLKRKKMGREEFGMVEEDGLNRSSIYLRIEGTPENYTISYDREAVREVIRQGFREQGTEIRKILNEEFGMFKKDSTPPESTYVRPFRIQWDEESLPEDSLPVKMEKKTKKTPLFRIRWEEEGEKQEEDSLHTGKDER